MYRKPIIYKNPDLILCSDLHLRNSIPSSRIDDYLLAQQRKLKFILELSQKHSCPILVAGDFGHKAEWKNWLLTYTIVMLQQFNNPKIYIIPGQHDLINHEIKKWNHSGIGVLHHTNNVEVLISHKLTIKSKNMFDHSSCYLLNIYPCPYGEKIPIINKKTNPWERNILMIHKMIIDKPLWEGQIARTGRYFLKKYPKYNMILSGDNHQSFVMEYKNKILINPGSIMRMTSDQKNHRPRVYLYYAKDNQVVPVYLPIQKKVFDYSHIKKEKEIQQRMDAYVSNLNSNQYEIGLSFERNLNEFLEKNKIKKKIKKIIIKNVRRKNE